MGLTRRLQLMGAGLVLSVALAGCEFFVQTVAPTPTLISAPPAQAQRPMVEVKAGRLEEAIRMTGRVEADVRQDLFFKAPGRIKSVRVRQGDSVQKDDVLADLETGGLESDLADAQKALETSELRLKAAQAQFADEKSGIEQDLLLAENDVVYKQQALEDLQKGPDEAELAAARGAVSSAKAALERLHRGPSQSELASAQSALASAAAAYNGDSDSFERLQGSRDELVAAARAAVAEAEAALAAARASLADLNARGAPTDAQAAREAEGRVGLLEAKLEAQRAAFYQAEADLSDLQNKPTPGQRLEAENAFAKAKLTHDSVVAGGASYTTKQQAEITFQEATRAYNDALAPASEAELRVAANAVATERAALLDLQAQLADVLGAGAREGAIERLAVQVKNDYAQSVADAQAKVADAEIALTQARYDRDIAESPAGPAELQRARDDLNSTAAAVARARASLDELGAPPDSLDVETAQQGLRNAEAVLADIEASSAESAITAAENALSAATLKRDNAKRKLEELAAGQSSSSIDITILENAVEQANIRLERLNEQTFENQIVAPFTGQITYVRGRPGDEVPAYQEIIGLADPSVLVLEAVVPEIDQSKLAVGQQVDVTIDQFPGITFAGRVSSLPRTIVSSTGQSIKIPETEIGVDWGRPGIELGMLARLKITIQVKDGVLKAPIAAVRTVNKRDFVETLVGEQRRSLPVTTGIRSDTEIEIASGLDEGTMVFASP